MILDEDRLASDELVADLEAERDLGRAMLSAYAKAHASDLDRYDVLAVEQQFVVPCSETTDRAGVIDLVLRDRQDGAVLIVDHKTYSRSLWTDMERILAIDDQCAGYLSAWRQVSGTSADGFAWNVLIKDSPKPPRLVQPKRKVDACACGRGEPHVLSSAREQATTAELFRAAMADHGVAPDDPRYADLLADLDARPRQYFSRVSVARTAADLDEWSREAAAFADEIAAHRGDRTKHVSSRQCPRCEYLPLCLADTPEARATYLVAEAAHAELDAGTALRGDLVSHSRISCWQECRRKHHYRYVERLRTTTEPRELRFGVGIHAALAEGYKRRDFAAMLPSWESWWRDEFARVTGRAAAPKIEVPF